MPSARPLRALLAATAAAAAVLLPAGLAAADEPAGTTVVGRLVQTQAEAAPGRQDEADSPLSWIETGQGAVRVAAADLAGVPAGSTVSVTIGGETADPTAPEGVEPARDVLATQVLTEGSAAPIPVRQLTNQVTIALVAPQGSRKDGVTLAQVVSAVDGPVADFWAEQSDGAFSLGVTAQHDWLTTQNGCQDPTALWNETARKVGFRPGVGKHLLVYLTTSAASLPGCQYALAEVGAGVSSGGRLYVTDPRPSIIAHELGHNFGLGHSSAVQCDGATDGGRCATQPYRDLYDVMGASWGSVGSLNAAQAARLGFLPAAAQRQLRAGEPESTAVLSPLGGRSGTRALHLVAGRASYWLEYRTPAGRDAWLGTADNEFGLEAGVLLRRAGGLPDTSLLLDGTPSVPGGWADDLQDALPVGVPVTLAGGWTVTVQQLGAEGATVDVRPGPAPAAAAAPAPSGGTGGVLPAGPTTGTGVATAPGPQAAPEPAPAAAPAPADASAGASTQAAAGAAGTPQEPGTVVAASRSPLGGSLAMAAAALALAGSLYVVVRRLRRTLHR